MKKRTEAEMDEAMRQRRAAGKTDWGLPEEYMPADTPPQLMEIYYRGIAAGLPVFEPVMPPELDSFKTDESDGAAG